MRISPLFSLLLLLISSISAVSIAPSDITTNSNVSCPAWTAWAATNITTIRYNESGYIHTCSNVSYVSYCIPTDMFINFSHARYYTDINCSRKDFCQGWTNFYIESTRNITSRSPDNLTRTCTNTTYVSWCIKDHSNIDYQSGRRYSQIDCSEWVSACHLVASTTLKRTERQGDNCRPCNVTAYRAICVYGSRTTNTSAQSQSVCGDWVACPQSAPINVSTAMSNSAPTFHLDSSGALIAVLLSLGLTALLVLGLLGRHQD